VYTGLRRVAWFPLEVLAEAVGGGERAARNSCLCHRARATTRLSFLVADTSGTASVHLDYSPQLLNKNSLFGGDSFFVPDPQKKNPSACVPLPVFPAFFGFPGRATTSPWFWISSKSSPSSRWQVRLFSLLLLKVQSINCPRI
jgi:hypothetical protein